jgi:hypothetical protein
MSGQYPSLDTYLARLPDGLASYPEALAKGATIRASIEAMPAEIRRGDGLPPRLRELLRDPPTTNAWGSEVEMWALVLAAYDTSFGTSGVAAYDTWAYELNRRLLGGPLYRVLFAVISPERLFVGASKRWAAFHRGTTMDISDMAHGGGKLRLTTPASMLPRVAQVALAAGYRAAFDLAGGKGVEVTVEEQSSTCMTFTASWR